MYAVTVNGLRKNYLKNKAGKFVGLNLTPPLDKFEVERGEIFGIIGPDGAGKTTLFRILATLILPDEGSATVEGYDVISDYKKIRNITGYMPGRFSLYPDLTVKENLEFYASVFGTTIKENYSTIEAIYRQLEPFATRRASKLSGGMKQKLALCCALVHKPSLILLDEPTTGVDPVSRKEFWQMLRILSQRGITIIISTPYMDEASLCDRIALMRNGSFMKIETPQKIVESFGEPLYAAKSDDMYKLLNDIRQFGQIKRCYTFGEMHRFTVNGDGFNAVEFAEELEATGHANIKVVPAKPTVEDCYMQFAEKDDE